MDHKNPPSEKISGQVPNTRNATPRPAQANPEEHRRDKGGPAGANQGGAPRGGSRAEPSHVRDAAKKDQKGA